jgi:hypothetical protein
LAGPSELPDPLFHAYRKDLADVALAGRVIASHYAEPLPRRVAAPAALRSAPSSEAGIIAEVGIGDAFALLDESLGWAWGYAGAERRVGYLPGDLLSDQ